jgi:hypothetical protein
MSDFPALSAPPLRTDPDNFAANFEAWMLELALLPGFLAVQAVATAAGAFQGAWDSGTIYAAGEAVSHDGAIWLSLQDGNEDNEPEGGAWWADWLSFKLNTAHPALTAGTLREVEHMIADGAAFEIDPANGSMQNVTLGANRAPKATHFLDGHAITLRVKDGSGYTLDLTDATFGSGGIAWMGDPPSLDSSDWTVIVMWKEDGQVYGRDAGVVA